MSGNPSDVDGMEGGSAELAVEPGRSVGRWLVIGGALAAGWFLYGYVEQRAENHPWGVGFLVALCIATAFAHYWWQDLRARPRFPYRTRPEDPRRAWVAPVAIVLVACVWGVGLGARARDNYLRPYCMYGARSAAQLDGCMAHVHTDDIDPLDTQAARFARGETNECLADAGPYCASASRWNTVEPDDQYGP